METPNHPLPKFQALLLGLQHVLAMYAGSILVPLLIGTALHFNSTQLAYLISVDIFCTGLATLFQLKQTPITGIALPVVLGSSIQAVSPLINIGSSLGWGAMYGATIVAGLFVILISGTFARLRAFFPPVVTGSLITVIGLSLIPIALQNWGGGSLTAKSFGEWQNLVIGFVTIVLTLLLMKFAKGFLKAIAVLMGIILGTLFAAALGRVSLTPVADAAWFHLPQPFFLGTPTFSWSASLTMIIIVLTAMVEATGVYFALADLTGKKLEQKDLARGYRAEGLAVVLSGIFNTFPYSTFSQNVAVVRLSGVKTKQPIYYAACLLLVLGLLPKFGALATIIPSAVLGGAMMVMFSTIAIQGLQILGKVDLNKEGNLLTAGLSIAAGLGISSVPTLLAHLPEQLQMVMTNGVVMTTVVAVILNLLLNGWPKADQDVNA
ncbi:MULTISPECIES: nucleobase:cation symporter-2 family protein [Fructobacillus]|uniref:Xanthine/uracil permease (UraA) n=1 Tax=Fructobacillus cardui TaxID=2893170 RepID=A0ABN9YT32_9LACO|nr:nucleobase:cation symporter-2 family protein [Fructobacillus sp. EFB-N1]KMK52637.1 Uric acid permease PucK [Fructobacillus sp. EFB-N1]CAK1241335.1 Xanthine/uracil permease (UraA) [Fructobacillus cardui]CAK1243807.1 Xanthine/uracil permease (UraA) [Fructobacillus cardui]CAK1245770.1 Xanthine/uracil permease (UraA) [Fructobacillus cardui]